MMFRIQNTPSPPPNGFTLLETVVTLLLVSLLATYAVLRWPVVDTPLSRAQQFASHLRLTQSMAMGRAESWSVVVERPNQYQIRRNDAAFSPWYSLGAVSWVAVGGGEVRFGQSGMPVVVNGDFVLGDGVSQAAVRVVLNTGTVVVQP